MSTMKDGPGYMAGRALARLMGTALFVSLPWLYSPHWWRFGLWFSAVYFLLLVVVLMGLWMGVVVHEFGHLAVALAVGAKVRGFRIGAENALFRVSVRGFRLVIGSPFHGGAVHYEAMPSVWKRASITLAGPLADLVFAGVVLSVRLPVMPAFTQAFAATLAMVGVRNLVPFRARTGALSDGARLFSLRADVRAQRMVAELLTFTRGGGKDTDGASRDQGSDQVKRILAAYHKGDLGIRTTVGQVASTLATERRNAELLELHRGLGAASGLMSVAESWALVQVTLRVSTIELPQEDAALAERRLDALLRYHDLHQQAEALAHEARRCRWPGWTRLAPTSVSDGTHLPQAVALRARHLPRQLHILPAWTFPANRAQKWSQSMRSWSEAPRGAVRASLQLR
jgi:hypothetical protein